ncbi:MAG: hypothetical protein EXR77_17875 [Myxococcales bacterium]|nr:hypothetical protein [Myxococcales bacterium]
MFVNQATAVGALVTGAASSLQLSESVVAATKDDGTDKGYGVHAVKGAKLVMSDVRVDGNRVVGVGAVGANTSVDLLRVHVGATSIGNFSKTMFGNGLYADDGAQVSASGLRIVGNTSHGVFANKPSTLMNLRGIILAGTQATPDGVGGKGVQAQLGATIRLTAARISANHTDGVFTIDSSTLIDIHGGVIDGTLPQPSDNKFGHGAGSNYGAKRNLRAVRISGNVEAGVHSGQNGQVDASGVLVDATSSSAANGTQGVGIAIEFASSLKLVAARLSGNRFAGLRVMHAGSKVKLRDVLVDGTLGRGLDGAFGVGILAALGPKVHLNGVRLSANHVCGAFATGTGTVIDGSGLLIDSTTVTAGALMLTSVFSVDGPDVRLTGARIVNNPSGGIYAVGPNASRLTVHGLDFIGKPSDFGPFDVGVQVDGGVARVEVVGSRIRHAQSAAASFGDSVGALRDSVIIDTLEGEHIMYDNELNPIGKSVKLSDGIVVGLWAQVEVANTVIFGQARAGVLAKGGQATLKSTLIGGGYLGTALVGSGKLIESGLLFFDNQSNHSRDNGLYVPKAPSPVPPQL